MKKSQRETLERIKSEWQFYLDINDGKIKSSNGIPYSLWNSNMLHAMSGSMQNCYDLIWMINTLDKKIPKKNK